MNIDNLKSQMRKGMLEFCVLLILKRGDAYASEMIARLKEAHLIARSIPCSRASKTTDSCPTAGKSQPRAPRANITPSLPSAISFSSSSSSHGTR